FLQNPERSELEAAKKIRPDIDDWTITDLYSSMPRIGGSFASSSAALLDATRATTDSDQAFSSTASPSTTAASARIMASSPVARYVNPELLLHLQEMKLKQQQSNMEKGRVTVEEMGQAPDAEKQDGKPKDNDQEND
ncbi:MAG: hypothetical protein PVI22_17020, partial [Lysobacterales bacterium]